MAKTEAIIFDFDETLGQERACDDAAFLAVCEIARQKYGIYAENLHQAVRRYARKLWRAASTLDYCRDIGISSWEGLYGDFNGDNPNLRILQQWTPRYRQESWLLALQQYGVQDLDFADELAHRFANERVHRHANYPDAEQLLQDLKPNYRLAMLTNGAPGIQSAKINGSGLARYFDFIIISGDVGIGKPDPRIFKHTLDRLDVSAGSAIMVGDSLERDIKGAQAAGIRAVWINRNSDTPPEDITPDEIITELSELRTVIS